MPLPVDQYIRQTNKSQRPVVLWLLSVITALAVLSLIVAAPLAAANHYPSVAIPIYYSFHTLCHQLPERSFFIAGHQFAVCARCTGLYAGFALVLLLYPILRTLHVAALPSPKWLFLAAAPLAVDFSLTFFGVWENTHTSRLLTGLILGGASVFYVIPGLVELSMRTVGEVQGLTPSVSFTMVTPDHVASAPSDYSAPERRI